MHDLMMARIAGQSRTALSTSSLLAHNAQAHAGKPWESLAFSVAFLVVGLALVLDLFGVSTKFREDNREPIAPWGHWVRERRSYPDWPKFCGWTFVLFGAFSTIWFLVAVLR